MGRFILHFGLWLLVISEARAQVTSSFTIIDYWVEKLLVSPGTSHSSIIPCGGELHGYLLSPSDSLKLGKSTVIIGLNPISEPWLNDWIMANRRTDLVVWIDENKSLSTHSWLSPDASKKMVRRLYDGLMKRNLSSETHLIQLLTEIDETEKSVKKLFELIPKERRLLITQHPSLSAFAESFQLEVVGSILESPEAESADPSVQRYSQLLKIIKSRQVRLITCDAGQNNRIAEQLSRDAKISPPVPLSVEYLKQKGQPGDNWPGLILTNAKKIAEAL